MADEDIDYYRSQIPSNVNREVIINGVPDTSFSDNKINTARYSALFFLPKFLFEQFSKLSNLFFLIVGLFEQIPHLSPYGRYITFVPLALILTVSAVKEIIEDLKRRQSDKKMNKLSAEIFDGGWRPSYWRDIKVGNIVRVKNGEFFPADIVAISTSEVSSCCYVQTASLDGETNYKLKQCCPDTTSFRDERTIPQLKGVITCEAPSNNLYNFCAYLQFCDAKFVSISADQLILRGSQLKNTHWVIGVVVYTGHETKIMLNSSHPTTKRSTIDYATNWLVLTLMAILLILTLLCASFYDVFMHESGSRHWYLNVSKDIGFTFHYSCITFFILFHNIIPISLTVTLEIVKLAHSYIISHDQDMYSTTANTSCIVKTSSIVEELGQVNYIFCDKTGTLTANEMILRKLSIKRDIYILNENSCFSIQQAFRTQGTDDFKFFIVNLLLCNTIIPEKGENSEDITYQSSSPDETSIVDTLAKFNYRFMSREDKCVTLNLDGIEEVWEILHVIDFTSNRKRMSVIVLSPNKRIYLLCKGADNVVMDLLAVKNDDVFRETFSNLESFAKDGLRTLCIAFKELTNEEYNSFSLEYKSAMLTLKNRELFVEDAASKIEKNLILLGATGIEDRLQTGVPEAISILKEAKIKVWMLTGDKLETAVNIGYSCGILDTSLDVKILNASNIEDCLEKLRFIQAEKHIYSTSVGKLRKHPSTCLNMALVVTGQDISFALDPYCLDVFLDVSLMCQSVICCRISPLQKKNILLMVKDHVAYSTTLAIGDGANDCSMIQSAHVGIGIVGREGMQAANTADFAIGDFSHLPRLLLVHGASCYRRICNCTYYCFYKNIVFNMISFFFSFYNFYSGLSPFSRFSLIFFNVAYTSGPPIYLGLLDQSCSHEAHYKVPYLYESIRKSSYFGIKKFIAWVLNGFLHAALIFFFCYLLCSNGVLTWDGHPISLSVFSNILLTHTLIVITFKAALEVRYWTWATHFLIWSGLVCFIITLSIFCRRLPMTFWMEPDFMDSDIMMFQSPLFWISLGIPLVVLLPDFIFHCLRNTWFTPSFIVIAQMEQQGTSDWNEPKFIKTVQDELNRSCESKVRLVRKYFGFAFSTSENANVSKLFPKATSLFDTTTEQVQLTTHSEI